MKYILRKIIEKAMAVPIFFKIMGIAFGLIILFCLNYNEINVDLVWQNL